MNKTQHLIWAFFVSFTAITFIDSKEKNKIRQFDVFPNNRVSFSFSMCFSGSRYRECTLRLGALLAQAIGEVRFCCLSGTFPFFVLFSRANCGYWLSLSRSAVFLLKMCFGCFALCSCRHRLEEGC